MAMKDMNIAKLTSTDLPLFNGITQDLFPAVETPVIDYGVVSQGLWLAFIVSSLQWDPDRRGPTAKTRPMLAKPNTLIELRRHGINNIFTNPC